MDNNQKTLAEQIVDLISLFNDAKKIIVQQKSIIEQQSKINKLKDQIIETKDQIIDKQLQMLQMMELKLKEFGIIFNDSSIF